MDINTIMTIALSVMGTGGLFLGQRLIVGLLDYNKSRKEPEKFMLDKGYQAGKIIYNNAIKHLTDEEAKQGLIQLFDRMGNYADMGWDAGIRNKPKPVIK